jgi:hypothetical protein
MSSSYYVTYGTDRLTFGGNGSVAWAASEPPPLPSMPWIASGSGSFSTAYTLTAKGTAGIVAGLPFRCEYFSSDAPASSVLTGVNLTSTFYTYLGGGVSSETAEATGSSFRTDVTFKGLFFRSINSSEIACSLTSRRLNTNRAQFYGGLAIPTTEASGSAYINTLPANTMMATGGKAQSSITIYPATGAYQTSMVMSSEFTAEAAQLSTDIYFGDSGTSGTSAPTVSQIRVYTASAATASAKLFMAWTASGEI